MSLYAWLRIRMYLAIAIAIAIATFVAARGEEQALRLIHTMVPKKLANSSFDHLNFYSSFSAGRSVQLSKMLVYM